METEGAGGQQQPPPPGHTLATAAHGALQAKCEFNMDNLSKPELLTLLSIMEGELEARDLVIEALRARRKEVFIQERYASFNLTDPFLALQRDYEAGTGDKERQAICASPLSVLEAVMAHCRKMQERMSTQLAAAESRQKKLEQEKLQLQSLEQEHRKLSAQLKDEREKNKHVVMMLVRECKQLAARVLEESQRFDDLSARLEEESKASARLQEELSAERQKGQQMEARMEKQLSELDTEREQLRVRLGREEARSADLRAESEGLRRQVESLQSDRDAASSALPAAAAKPKATSSVAVGTDPVSCRPAFCQTDPTPTDPSIDGVKKAPLTIPVKPSIVGYAGMSLPKSQSAQRGAGGLPHTENGPSVGDGQPSFIPASSVHSLHSPNAATALPAGVSPRVQAARYKFQPSSSEQDQNGNATPSPPSRDVSPTSRDSFAAKQQARHTVTQVLSRFTSPPASGALRPGLPHSSSEGGPFAGRLGHPQIGLKSPTVGRIDRGNPPPIPPKKPGLSQTPSPPHPPVKVMTEGSRSPAAGLGVPSKATTPQLPPKPALDLGGTGGGCSVPALTTSQVGACPPQSRGPHQAACTERPPATAVAVRSPSINPVSASSCRPTDSPLATASGWRPSIVPPLTRGDPVPLADGHTLLFQAATQGNVTLLSMLLNQDPTVLSPLVNDGNAALYSAARHGHTDCVKLLLASGVPCDAPDQNGFTPLHIAATHAHLGCVEVLVANGADVNRTATGGHTPLYLACGSGKPECVRALLDAGADRTLITADSCTTLHAAVSSGQVGCLELLLHHRHPGAAPSVGNPGPGDIPRSPVDRPVALGTLLNYANRDSWTAAHIAASKGFKDCLEVLCGHSEHDLEKRDKCNRTVHDVATDDCKELLENLGFYRVLIQIHRGSEVCTVDMLEDTTTIGAIIVHRHTNWGELSQSLSQVLTTHFQLLCGGWDLKGGATLLEPVLGLGTGSISSVLIGDATWPPGRELPQSPWELIRKRHSQHITVTLKGLSESSLNELTYDSLMPLQLLRNYSRLVEQYHNVIFHGLEGSCQEYIANQISHCIKHKQEVMGVGCDIVRIQVDENMSKDQLLETFINCGFLVSVKDAAPCRRVVALLEGLERATSLWELLGDLCEGLENRATAYPFFLLHAPEASGLYYFQEGSFLLGTLAKSQLHGTELLLQQHFRWVQLRWDSEPLRGLLSRHLRRKLVHKMRGQLPDASDLLCRAVAWVCSVWHQINGCLSCLGTTEALMGPQMFFSCPVVPEQPQAILRWLARLWNAVVVPRVEEAIISRLMMKRSTVQRQAASNRNLSPGQQAVVKAALSILVNKAILQGCPLPKEEIDKHLLAFQGTSFPLSVLSTCRSFGRKGWSGSSWRKANTSPRNKGAQFSSWGSSGTLKEGSLSNPDGCFTRVNHSSPNERCGKGEQSTFALCSHGETDLVQELQTMCSSKSEPDISKITLSKEEFVLFPGSPSRQAPLRANDEANAQNGRCQSNSLSAGPASSDKLAVRPRSQLPIPSADPSRIRGPPRGSSSSSSSSRTRQEPANSNDLSCKDIWVLHADSHDSNDNNNSDNNNNK
ncbi:cortactin-binding protein 2 isoform X1 [Scleropages formosus]|uniref:Cortactin-binding protein 2 n=1 Tax=Scleropages formosus TaxID=113540 RepID=A0A8C9QQW7_SCLFO|nr:cortactin-binding protein 2-like isoform X1 [Scleropages formosus]